ncbi:hypothetical protein RHMOL_Rhmol05G0252400 [Rhododendron molle]|uniref:Uncharacterized protein n=1 Tax=Rhododendron molle TaxID=49168 RepID=A0ACC0NTX2_RHOML|nr:hypothetical protein RHMOL_Rhmol05G0252400 [Rhododendron molle]
MADWIATVALGKLSDARVDYDNGNALRAIWAPLLLLHLGGPDTITAYSIEDNRLWMRHLFGLGVQVSVAVYVIYMSRIHSWFSIMSIPALVAGFIKYGERTWVLWSVSREKYREIVPFGDVGSDSNLGNNYTSEDKNYIRGLCKAHRCVKAFKTFTEWCDTGINALGLLYPAELFSLIRLEPIELDDVSQFWKVIEVEMGLMFDLLYTKAPINFRKRGCILRCITLSCTVAVLIGLIIRLGEGREKWHKVDIAITEVLLVGALALEIYAIISLYLFSDWAMLWLIKNKKAEQVIQLRKIKSWLFFLPKEYRCKTVGQFNLIDYWFNKPDQEVGWSLLGIKRWLEEYFKDTLKKNVPKTAVIDPSLLLHPILKSCRSIHLIEEDPMIRTIEEDPIWKEFFDTSFDEQILLLHIATEVCYNLEMEWDTDDAANQNNRDGTASQQHTMPGPSDSSSSWEGNKELCRTLSHYMMYLLVMRSSLLLIATSHDLFREFRNIRKFSIRDGQDVRAACRDFFEGGSVTELLKSKQKDSRWETLKWVWVRMLCHEASKGQRNEHFRQLSKGGEFLTFLWFFLPQSKMLRILPDCVGRINPPTYFPWGRSRELAKGDIAITEVLLVGALALEMYLFSDWAMIWLIKHNIDANRILNCCQRLTSPDLPPRRAVGEDLVWKEFFDRSFEEQIVSLHIATEICYNLEMEWDVHDASEDDRDSAVSQHTMPPFDSSLSWEENRELCRTLSRYMMYLLAMRPSLLPTSSSDDYVSDSIPVLKPDTDGLLDVKAACRCLCESDEFRTAKIIKEVQSKHKDERWDIWKLMWVRMLCYAMSKGQRNEHFRQLSQGGEFITFLWFFLPQSGPVLGISSPESRIGLPVFGPKSREVSLSLSFGSVFNNQVQSLA